MRKRTGNDLNYDHDSTDNGYSTDDNAGDHDYPLLIPPPSEERGHAKSVPSYAFLGFSSAVSAVLASSSAWLTTGAMA